LKTSIAGVRRTSDTLSPSVPRSSRACWPVKAKVAEAKAARLNAAAQNAPDLDDLIGDL
jgi:hypothetical protein